MSSIKYYWEDLQPGQPRDLGTGHDAGRGNQGFRPAVRPSRPDAGPVRSRWEMFNQNGDQVLLMEGYGIFRRRHPASPAEIALLERDSAQG